MKVPISSRREFLGMSALAASGALIATELRASSAQAEGVQHLESVRQFFELMHRKQIDSWAELWVEGGRILVPYPPAGFGTSIEGKATILAAFRDLFANFESFDYAITGLYPAADSDAVCVEYNVRAILVGGAEYTNQNIAVFRFERGLVSAYHDYFDPRRFQAVVDALPGPGSTLTPPQ